MESAFHTRNRQKGHLTTLRDKKQFQKNSLRLKGTKVITVLRKRGLIQSNVHQLPLSTLEQLSGNLKL